ncbi:hypothetical protein LTS18_009604 [Coniosporium uncinatum]|uniref:Uncharacterized protein n=1 Tax=Coniosporium uncinatum TaxID=93489 RepID=A0ACC3DMD6_9PEZI|nr:hypothetical protein LTS18_009604 [Coniosporium uncinatum]
MARSRTAPADLSPRLASFPPQTHANKYAERTVSEEGVEPTIHGNATLQQQVAVLPPPSSASSERFSFEDHANDTHEGVELPLLLQPDTYQPVLEKEEPAWEMLTKPAYTVAEPEAPSNNHKRDGISEIPDTNEEVPKLSVARSVSVTKTHARKRAKLPLAPELERLQQCRKPLTPTLVELRCRTSQRVEIESV